MKYSELQPALQNLIKRDVKTTQLAKILGVSSQNMDYKIKSGKGDIPAEELSLIEKYFDVTLMDASVPIIYRPDVYLSAGYGVEVYDERSEMMMIDNRLLISEHGNRINPAKCEVVHISGNSMAPEYRHGDRVIIDRSDLELSDGHIYAFRYKGSCYVKEINLLGNKIKCISLNKDYDPFYINEDEDFLVLGRIIPRVRL